jgi:hypothetical protein
MNIKPFTFISLLFILEVQGVQTEFRSDKLNVTFRVEDCDLLHLSY